MWNANSLDGGTGLPRYCGCLWLFTDPLQCIWSFSWLITSLHMLVKERWTEKHVILMVDTGNKRMIGIRTPLWISFSLFIHSLLDPSEIESAIQSQKASVRYTWQFWLAFPTAGKVSVSTLQLFWENKVTETWSQADLEENTLSLCY